MQAIEHADIPLFRVVEAFRPERSDTYNALFQSIVQLLPRAEGERAQPASGSDSPGIHLQGIDLFLNFVEDIDASFKGSLLFNAAIFAESTVENILMRLESLLRDAVAAPDVATQDLFAQPDLAVMIADPPVAVRRVERMHHGDIIFSPFEIEEALRRGHEAVSDAIAFTAPHHERGDMVGVAAVLHPGQAPSMRALRTSLATSLPARLLPRVHLVHINELPKHPRGASARAELTGLLTKRGLLDEHDTVSHASLGDPTTSPPPLAELLDTVLDAVRRHTRDERVATATPLMDAGLNSMNAVQLALRLEERTGVALPPTLIFQYSTAEAIARPLHSELMPAFQEQQPRT